MCYLNVYKKTYAYKHTNLTNVSHNAIPLQPIVTCDKIKTLANTKHIT